MIEDQVDPVGDVLCDSVGLTYAWDSGKAGKSPCFSLRNFQVHQG